MNAKLAACWILTVALAAGGGALWERSRHPEGSPAARPEGSRGASGHTSQAPSAEGQAFPQENVRPGASSAPSPHAPASTSAAVTPQDVERLLAQARAALQAKDLKAFSDPFLALLDAGEPAYAGLAGLFPELMKEMRSQEFMQDPANMEAVQEFYTGFMTRAPKLGGLMDALLVRPGEPDQATGFALQLWQMGAKSTLPRERQVQILMAMLRKEPEAGEEDAGMGNSYMAAGILLGKLKASEALPEVEKLALEGSQQMAWAIPQAIAQMGGPEALASLRRILDKAQDPQTRQMLLSSLAQMKDANPLLWEMAEKSEDAQERAVAFRGLASRPENLERILATLQTPGLDEQDRMSLLQGVVSGSSRNPAAKEALWKLYESTPSLQNALFQQLAAQGDARAKGMVSEQMRAGTLSEETAGMLGMLAQQDRKWARENAETFRGLVSSASSARTRVGAFQALAVVDRPGAVQGLMAVFSRLSEEERMGMTRQLQYQGGKEGREALQRIAGQDTSERVRKMAAASLKEGSGVGMAVGIEVDPAP